MIRLRSFVIVLKPTMSRLSRSKGYYEAQGKLKSIDGAQGITATEKFAVEALGL